MTEIHKPSVNKSSSNGTFEKNNETEMDGEPSHHARRPMNAFLIFCKRHRSVVRDKYPNLENRSITKILGEWWAHLDDEDKSSYTELAKQYKDAFFTAHPDFKWYKLPAPPLRTFSTRPSNNTNPIIYSESENFSDIEPIETKVKQTNNNHLVKVNYNVQPSTSKLFPEENQSMFTPGKLADETQMGGLSSLILTEDTADNYENTDKIHYNSNNHVVEENKAKNDITTVLPKKRHFCDKSENIQNELENDDALSMKEEFSSDKLQEKLQDELSKTSRIFELSFGDTSESDFSEKQFNGDGCHNIEFNDSIKSTSSNGSYLCSCRTNNVNLNHSSDLSCNSSSNQLNLSKVQPHFENFTHVNKNSCLNNFEQNNYKLSGRTCKGKRYQEFMTYGGLLINKRPKREESDVKVPNSHDTDFNDFNDSAYKWKSCNDYIKENCQNSDVICLNEKKSLFSKPNLFKSAYNNSIEINDTGQELSCKENTIEESKEINDNIGNKVFKASDFDLDAKIRALPSLSLEKFQQKKRENKKRRKNSSSKHKDSKSQISLKSIVDYRTNNVSNSIIQPTIPSEYIYNLSSNVNKKSVINSYISKKELAVQEKKTLAEEHKSAIIGSKKRKPRKISITRLDINSTMKLQSKNFNLETPKNFIINRDENSLFKPTSKFSMNTINSHISEDICGLTTLAEVAAKLQS